MADQAPAASTRRLRWPSYALVLVVGAWLMIKTVSNFAVPRVMCGRPLMPDAQTVVMLSASWCGYCRQARTYMHEQHIKHCEYDIETDQEGIRRFAAQAVKVIPILTLGEQTFVGFEREALDQALAAKGLRPVGED